MSVFERVIKNVEQVLTFYKSDLRHLTPEQLTGVPMGNARRACDYTWEVVEVNGRIAKRIAGEQVPPPNEGWTVCPDDQADVEKLAAALDASGAELIAAFRKVGEEHMLDEFETPMGTRTPLEMISMAITHTMYHDGQLNLLQGLHGDTEVHWPL